MSNKGPDETVKELVAFERTIELEGITIYYSDDKVVCIAEELDVEE